MYAFAGVDATADPPAPRRSKLLMLAPYAVVKSTDTSMPFIVNVRVKVVADDADVVILN
jgi:hypothetical protein